MTDVDAVAARIADESAFIKDVVQEVERVIVGQKDLLRGLLTGLLADGHVLLEGVPGLAKSLAVQSLATALGGTFRRIQFTPDLLPSDLLGTQVYNPKTLDWAVHEGPVFGNFLLADEINRAPAKVQSALLEAMQERQVSLVGETRELPAPFLVLATQNPVEQEGTYPLPEAQVDRFFFKLMVKYPTLDELKTILDRTTMAEQPTVQPVLDGPSAVKYQQLVREVVVAPHVQDYAARLILTTHAEGEYAADVTNKYVRYGASPRGAQTLILAGKVTALLDKRYNVSFDDIKKAILPALRHRLILNFEGEAEGISPDEILEQIIDEVPTGVTV